MPGTIIEIRDLQSCDQSVAQGVAGEVWVKGPQVMAGYWNRPTETADVLHDGYLRTGDVGYLDQDGYLYLIDRIKDVVLCSGYNVYPRVIEEALHAHPDVAEALVIGLPDPYRGESPHAYVVLKHGATASPEDLRQHLAERINKIEMPATINIWQHLPKSGVGKLSKKDLKEKVISCMHKSESMDDSLHGSSCYYDK